MKTPYQLSRRAMLMALFMFVSVASLVAARGQLTASIRSLTSPGNVTAPMTRNLAPEAISTIVNFDFNSGNSYGSLTPALASGVLCQASSTESFNSVTGTATGGTAFTTNATAGTAINMTNSSGTNTRYFEFVLTGASLPIYNSYKVYVQAQRSATGAQTVTLAYSTDGTNFTNFGTTLSPADGSFVAQVFDLSSIAGLNNRSVVYFRLLASGASGTGTLRIDNFQVQANSTAPSAPSLAGNKSATLQTDLNGNGFVNPGDTLMYSVTYTNSGTDATNVVFTDVLNGNLTLVGGSINASPIAVNDSYQVLGNVSINVNNSASGVLGNDFDPAGGSPLTVTGIAGCSDNTAPFNCTSARGGDLVVQSNGQFSYNPPPGFEGADFFAYTISDGTKIDVGTATLNVSGMIWFIDNNAGSVGDGRLGTPFNSISNFNSIAADDPGDNIFLYRLTATNYTGPLTLLANQKLIGQGATASLTSITGLTPPAFSAALPSTSGTRPVIAVNNNGANAHNLTISTGNTLRGFDLQNTSTGSNQTGAGLFGTNFNNLTASEISVNASSNQSGNCVAAISLDQGSGTASINATFTSVSSNNCSNGILLADTTGSFTVTGDGSNTSVGGNSTGGTISNAPGADGAVAGNGVYLSNTTNVTLRRMTINGVNQNHGIRGLAVTNFTLEYSTVGAPNPTNAASVASNTQGTSSGGQGEGAIYFGTGADGNIGLSGTGTFTNNNISAGRYDNMRVVNGGGTLNRLTITGSTFGLNSAALPQANAALTVIATRAASGNTILNSTVTGNTFTGSPGNAANFTGQEPTTALGISMDTIFQNNTISNNHANNNIGGSNLTVAGFSNTTFNVSNNNMRDANGSAITLQMGAPVNGSTVATSFSGTVNNNTIGVSGVAGSGSASGNGIFCSFADNTTAPKGQVTLAITNNQIRRYNGNAGIYADNTGGNYDINFTITGNLTAEPGPMAFAGLALTAGAPASSNDIDVCANITGNNFSAGDPANANDIIIGGGASGASSIRLPGLSPASNPTQAQVQSFVLGNNNVAGTVVAAYVDSPATFNSTFLGGAACSTPSTFAPTIEVSDLQLKNQEISQSRSLSPNASGGNVSPTFFARLRQWLNPVIAAFSTPVGYVNLDRAFNKAAESIVPSAAAATMAGETVTVPSSGSFTLPAGKSLTVMFNATLSGSFTGTAITNQASVSGTGFGPILSNNLSTPVIQPPMIAKSFVPANIALSGTNQTTSTLTLVLTNPNPSQMLSGIAFTDPLAGGLQVDATPMLSNGCGGSFSPALAGGQTALSYSGGSIIAGGNCTISFKVNSTSVGAKTNATSGATSAQANAGTASNTATLNVLSAPSFSKNFGAASVVINGTTSLNFNITNNDASFGLTGVSFTDTLPAGLTVATGGPVAACGGTLSTTAPSTISFSGGTLAASGNCSFSVTVTGTTAGAKNNSVSLTTNETGTNTTPATSTLNVFGPPTISKSFTPNTIVTGQSSTLGFSITNPASNPGNLTGISFTDTLPAGITIADESFSTCGGTVNIASNVITLTGGNIASGSTCNFSRPVTGTAASGAPYTNTISSISSTNGGTNNTPATANITVSKANTTATINNAVALGTATVVGQPYAVDASVSVTAPGSATPTAPTGTITVSDGSQTCTITLPATSCNLTSTSTGSPKNITATYNGDSNFNASAASTSVPHTVNKANTTTAITSDNPDPSSPGGNVTVNFTVTPVAPGAGTPTGNVVVTVSGGAETCTGTVAAGSCVITLTATGSRTLTATYAGDSNFNGSASAGEPHTVITPLMLTKSFLPTQIKVGETSVMTFAITNNNPGSASNISFNDTFPAGIEIDSPVVSTNTCGGSFSPALAGAATSFNYVGGSLAGGGGTCTITVQVKATTAGLKNNTTGAISSNEGGTGSTSNTATLTVVGAPTLSKSFTPSTVLTGQGSSLGFTITNNNSTVALSGIQFTDTLPAGLTVATSGPTSTCGGTLSTTAPNTISFTGGTLAAGNPNPTTCTFSVNVLTPQSGVFNNTSGIISANESGPGATSNTAMLTVNKANTTTAITSDTPDPSVVGQPYAVTANVSVTLPGMGTPTGTITVSDGSQTCTITLPAASCNLTSTSPGSKTLTATYNGDANYNGSTSAGASHQVNKADTTATITADTPDPSVVGQPYAVTANVTVNAPGAGTPTGTITVSDGSQTCTITLPATSCNLTSTTAGAKTLTATYNGDANFNASPASAGVPHQVNKANTTTAITSDNPDPSAVGQSVTVNFTVTASAPGSGTPTGNVTVSDGVNSCVGTVAAGTCNITLTTAGARTLTATYAGDTNYNGSVSAGEPHTVNQAATTTAITNDTPDPSVVGQPYTVTFSVTVNAPGSGTPTGTVTVSDGSQTCMATLPATSCNLTSTTAGAKNLTATYSGDANFSGSMSATAPHTVNKANTTIGSLTDSPDPSVTGQPYTVGFTLSVVSPGAGTPTGTVTVSDGTGGTCTATLPSTSCSLTSTTVGLKTLTYTYNGDANFNASSNTAGHQVNKANTTTAITSDNPDPSAVGQSVTVNFTVTAVAPGSGTPTGNVTVSDGVNNCTGTVAAGTCNITLTTPGNRTLTATYAGDTNYNGSVSAGEPHLVANPPALSKSFTPSSVPVGGTSTLQFTINNTNGFAINGLAFTDTLPAGVTVATTGPTATCGGTLTTTAPDQIAFTGGSVNANSSCQFSVTVTGATFGVKNNTTSTITSSNAGTGTAATAQLKVIAPPGLTKAFGSPSIPFGATTALTFTISNPNTVATTNTALSGIAFTDTLPAGVTVATSGPIATCGGTLTTTAPNSISFSGGSLAAGGSCNFNVTVTGAQAGAWTNTVNSISSTEGGTNSTPATANIIVVAPPVIAKSFSPTSVPVNGISTLTLSITNPAANTVALTGVGVIDNFPAGLQVDTAPMATNSCGTGTFAPVANATSVTISGATIPVNTTCTFSVKVKGTTPGAKVNNTGNVGSTNGGAGNFATATLLVNNPPMITPAPASIAAGSAAMNFTVATVSDIEDPASALVVTVNGGTSATVNGVTLNNIVNMNGTIKADIATTCIATTANFTLTVTDTQGSSTNGNLLVTVTANTQPVLSYSSPQTVSTGQALTVNPATGPSDNGSVASIVVWNVAPATFTGSISVNPSGVVSINNANPSGAFTVTIRATDNCGLTRDAQFTLNVVCPTITLGALPNAEAGINYSASAAASPAGTYTYSIISGNLPSGLTLNSSTGAVTGLPTVTGTYNFTLKADAGNGCMGTRAYSLIVSCPIITVNPVSLPAGATGTPYSAVLSATPATGNYTFTVTAGSLPPGLSLNPATGQLTGTPTVNGAFTFTVTATGFGSCTGSRPYTVQIGTGGCPTITLGDLTNGSVGQLYSQSVAASPAGVYTYALTSGSLPPGLTLFDSIGLVFGYPTSPGNFAFTIKATDANGCMGSKNYTVNIGLGFLPSILPDATLNRQYDQQLTPLGTLGVGNFRVAGGRLPGGLTLSPSGRLTGTPNEMGSFPITVTVTDQNNSGDQSLTLKVNDSNAPVLGGSISDPFNCKRAGSTVKVNASVNNSSGASQTANFTANLPVQILALPGTCVASTGTCTVVNGSTVTWNGNLSNGQTATISYQAQIADDTPSSAQICIPSTASFVGGGTANAAACTTINCPTNGPGFAISTRTPISDQKAGSVLIYNIYTSATDPTRQNTRLSITNTDTARPAYVHLFFVDGASCSVADSYLCLTPNQTSSFLASDLDPGTTGYAVAVAVDTMGCPTNFNHLIGDAYVKFASGHQANLAAESITAIAGGKPFCDANSVTAQLNFDGISYAPVPRALSVDNIGSRADGNDTLLILNRIGGNLGLGTSSLGSIFGIMYDDAENSLSFSVTGGCQLRSSISNNFPRTAPRFEQFIPAGRSGWMRLYSQSDIGITGSVINYNANAAATAGAFNQGHNLHVLTNSTAASYIIPVFPPSC